MAEGYFPLLVSKINVSVTRDKGLESLAKDLIETTLANNVILWFFNFLRTNFEYCQDHSK